MQLPQELHAVYILKPDFYVQVYSLFCKQVGYRRPNNFLPNKLKFNCVYMTIHIDSHISCNDYRRIITGNYSLYFFPVAHSCTHVSSFSLDLNEPLCVALP